MIFTVKNTAYNSLRLEKWDLIKMTNDNVVINKTQLHCCSLLSKVAFFSPKLFLLVNLYQKENNYILFFFISFSLTHAWLYAHRHHTHIYTWTYTIYAYISHTGRRFQSLKFLSNSLPFLWELATVFCQFKN